MWFEAVSEMLNLVTAASLEIAAGTARHFSKVNSPPTRKKREESFMVKLELGKALKDGRVDDGKEETFRSDYVLILMNFSMFEIQ